MVSVASSKKRAFVLAACACVVACLIAVPAHAMYYVHSSDYGVGDDVNGMYPVLLTVDGTAQGQGIWTEEVFVPANDPTVANALDEALYSSESQQGVNAIHDYDADSAADWLAAYSPAITLNHAESQKPGTHTTEDEAGTAVSDPSAQQVARYDHVTVKY